MNIGAVLDKYPTCFNRTGAERSHQRSPDDFRLVNLIRRPRRSITPVTSPRIFPGWDIDIRPSLNQILQHRRVAAELPHPPSRLEKNGPNRKSGSGYSFETV